MNRLTGKRMIDPTRMAEIIAARDREIDNPFSKDAQVTAIRGARRYLGDRLIRTAKPHKILDPANGPLIAVRLNILTRKTLGGLHTNLDAPGAGSRRAGRSPASMRPARSPASAAAATMATTRWKARFSAAACFRRVALQGTPSS